MNIKEIREKYPQYNDLSDEGLARAIHGKFYTDLPFEDFSVKVGLSEPKPKDIFRSRAGDILARSIGRGASAIPDIAMLPFKRKYGIPLPSEKIGEVMDAAGMAEAETDPEKLASSLVSGYTSAASLPVGGLASGISGALSGGTSELLRQADFPGWAQAAGGFAVGMGTPAVIDAAATGVRGLGRGFSDMMAMHSQAGRDKLVARALRESTDDVGKAVTSLGNVEQYIPGSKPTTAQATGDYGLLATERALRARDPRINKRMSEQNAARADALGEISQTPMAVTLAKKARDDASLPSLELAYPSSVDVSGALAKADDILNSGVAQRDAVRQAIERTKGKLENVNPSNVEQVYGIRQDLTDMFEGRVKDIDKDVIRAARKQLMGLKDSIDEALSAADPNFSKYLSTYVEKSKPINQMETAQEIERNVTNTATDLAGNRMLSPAKWARSVEDQQNELAKTFTPDQMRTLDALTNDLKRSNLSNNSLAIAPGSDTMQKAGGLSRIDSILGGPMNRWPWLGRIFEYVPKTLGDDAQQAVRNQFTDAILNPDEAARLYQLLPLLKERPDLLSPLAQRLSQYSYGGLLGSALPPIPNNQRPKGLLAQ